MFRKGYRLPFKLAGIPLYLDVSFLLILPLMVWLTAQNLRVLLHQPQFGLDLDPTDFRGAIPLLLGLVAVLGLFVSIVLHELGHSLTARRYGVKVRRITLWFLGGVAEFEEMPRQRGAEAIVGIAGPIVSFVLAGLFWTLAVVIPSSAPLTWIVVWYLGMVNLMLGLFNLLPALPLDGGRILRSLLALRLPHARATLIAGNISKVLAVALGVYGLFANLWLLVLAFFIFNAANSETRQSVVVELLRGIGVDDLMNRDVRSVPAAMPLGELPRMIFEQRHHSFPVVDDQNRLIGVIGVEQMQNAPPDVPVWQAMSTQILSIPQHASALDAFTKMGQNDFGRLIVLDDAGHMAGIITKADLMRAIQVRMIGFRAADGTADGPYAPPPQPRPFSPYPASDPVGYTGEDGARDPQRYARPL
jgi:Zn-dependent protease